MLNMKSKIFKYIYAMLCLLPAIAVGVTCLYVANNDNAYQSYSDNSTETINVNSVTDFDYNVEYYLINSRLFENQSIGNANTNRLYFRSFDVLYSSSSLDVSNAVSVGFYASNGNIIYYFYDSTNTSIGTIDSLSVFKFKVSVTSFLSDFPLVVANSNTLYKLGNENTLDNVFYYSLDKVENSSVFSWVKSNFLYSGVNQFVGIFGGTNSNISFYLTWLLTISLCYLGFEVLMLFINMSRNLIHSFTDKDRW